LQEENSKKDYYDTIHQFKKTNRYLTNIWKVEQSHTRMLRKRLAEKERRMNSLSADYAIIEKELESLKKKVFLLSKEIN
jgi:hypothetical protein